MGEHLHPTIATTTGPACPQPHVAMESSKFSTTSLSEMKTDDVKKNYCPKKTRFHMGSSLSIIHSSNWQMATFNRARLLVTQSSNGCRDVGGPLLLGV
jgi:hypothetical protein